MRQTPVTLRARVWYLSASSKAGLHLYSLCLLLIFLFLYILIFTKLFLMFKSFSIMPMKNHKQSIVYTWFKMLKRDSPPDGWQRRCNSSKKSPKWKNWHLLKGDQPWVFTGRTDIEPETPILWPPDVKSWLTGKDPDAGKDWGQEEKGMTEDEMVGWHHWFNGHGFGWTLGVGKGQGGLACCGSWGYKESDMTEQLNWTESKCD